MFLKAYTGMSFPAYSPFWLLIFLRIKTNPSHVLQDPAQFVPYPPSQPHIIPPFHFSAFLTGLQFHECTVVISILGLFPMLFIQPSILFITFSLLLHRKAYAKISPQILA